MNNFSSGRHRFLPVLFVGFGFVLIAASVYFVLRNAATPTYPSAVPVKVDYAAPALTLTAIDGKSVSLHDYLGQVVLVNLWATWCPPCKEEMPALETFYRRHKQEGFAIVAINDGDPTEDVVQFVKDYNLSFPVWLDPTYEATERAFKTLNLPSSYVIDRKGRIVLRWVGGIQSKTLEQYVTPIIQEQP